MVPFFILKSYILFMINFQVQPHDFEHGGPKKQYTLNFASGYFMENADGTISYPFNSTVTTNNTTFIGYNDNGITIDDLGVHINGNVEMEPREGDVRFDPETNNMKVYINGSWVDSSIRNEAREFRESIRELQEQVDELRLLISDPNI